MNATIESKRWQKESKGTSRKIGYIDTTNRARYHPLIRKSQNAKIEIRNGLAEESLSDFEFRFSDFLRAP
jgi:hypothetical protein